MSSCLVVGLRFDESLPTTAGEGIFVEGMVDVVDVGGVEEGGVFDVDGRGSCLGVAALLRGFDVFRVAAGTSFLSLDVLLDLTCTILALIDLIDLIDLADCVVLMNSPGVIAPPLG
ncbi:hypothetical protein [Polynucleobacter sp. JS-Safj-400b-B2]|uniref:hypothetical protein n=1 Tax=Polynucleobacter sp. JS-Safj-400b-B2 TaxID=2576921 RepID=UPI0021056715|nr:hypothetical protein [Polynucleobacter sp. JS-Safj-400b-B2]